MTISSFCRHGNVCSVTIRARRGSGLVEENILPVDGARLGVTRRALHVLMSSLERKVRAVMIEERRTPLVRVVARRAVIGPCGELVAMRVLVALGAGRRRALELHMHHAPFQVRRSMAFDACHGSMGAGQRKSCCCVIELRNILPFFRGVTYLAT